MMLGKTPSGPPEGGGDGEIAVCSLLRGGGFDVGASGGDI